MPDRHSGRVAILYPGDYETRQNASPENNRLAKVFQSLANLGVHAEPAVYNDHYFAGDGRIIDQVYQPRLPEGMIRCYLVHDKIVGFGHQAVNALFPAPPGKPPSGAPQPGPRLYHPPNMPDFQALKNKVEQEWVPAMQRLLGINTESLPILWDCDFLLGPKNALGEDTYVLCEINVSSVAPFPESAPPCIAEATLARLKSA